MRATKKMGRLRKERYLSSMKSHRGFTKNETAKSKVRGFLDDLPPVEEVFPFFNFQPELDLFTHDRSHRSKLDISGFLAPESLEIPQHLLSFPTYSQDEWIWLGENGYDAAPLEPVRGALLSNREEGYDDPPLEPIRGSPPSNSIDFDQFALVQEPVYLYSNAYAYYEEIEKRDYYQKRVRFADRESEHAKRKTDLDEYRIDGSSRKKANIFGEKCSLVSTESRPSVAEHPSEMRNHFAHKCETSRGSVHIETMPSKEPSKSSSIECIRFDTPADILAFARAVSKKESESTASNDNNKVQVAAQSCSSSGQVKRAHLTREEKTNREISSIRTEPPITGCDAQEDGMMGNLAITPKSADSKNLTLESEETENYFFASPPGSSKEGEKKTRANARSSVLSKVKREVVKEEQPRRSTRIHLRQCRGKQNDLKQPLWPETEWWVK